MQCYVVIGYVTQCYAMERYAVLFDSTLCEAMNISASTCYDMMCCIVLRLL